MAWVAGGVDRMWNDADGMNFGFNVDIAGNLAFAGDFTGGGDLPALEHVADSAPSTGLARRTGDSAWALDDGTTPMAIGRDGHGVVLPTGVWGDVRVPFAATVVGVSLLANATGSCVVDIYRDSYANYPPTAGDSICGSSKPTISNGIKYSDIVLSGWSTAITADDILRFNIDSISAAITKLVITLALKRYI
jgi:hypothetical protein